MSRLTLLGWICLFLWMAIPLSGSTSEYEDIRALYRRTSWLEEQAKYARLHQVYDSIIGDATVRNDMLTLAFFTRLKGRAYLNEDKYDSAMQYIAMARDLAMDIKNDSILGIALLNMATLKRHLGEIDSAHFYHTVSLKTFKDSNDTVNMADALQGLMNYYSYVGELDKALEAGLQSNYLFSKKNRTINYIESLNDVANIYEKLGALDTAMTCYQEVYRLSRENQLPRTAATAMNNIAVIHYRKGDFDKSMEYLKKAIAFNDSVGDKGELAMLYGNISYLYAENGDQEQKVAALEKSLQYAKEINNVERQLSTMRRLGDHFAQTGDDRSAEKYYLEALALARTSKERAKARALGEALSGFYEKQNRWEESSNYLRMALAYQDSMVTADKARIIEKTLSSHRAIMLDDMIKNIKTEHKAEVARLQLKSRYQLIISLIILVMAVILLLFFRMRARKNRIIAEQRIRQLENEKKLMRAQAVLVGQENERKRIAHDLHDGIGVLLSTASVQFSRIKTDPEDPEATALLEKARRMINEASGEVRKISRNMMPGVLSRLGLFDALEELFDSAGDIEGLTLDVQLADNRNRLPENTEIMVYRIVQELLNNTMKHAKASEIQFTLNRSVKKLDLHYADNGIGFDPEIKDRENGLGLAGIRSRVDFLRGAIEIDATAGTTYNIQIPLNT